MVSRRIRGVTFARQFKVASLWIFALFIIAFGRFGRAIAAPPTLAVTVSSVNLNPTSVFGGTNSAGTVYLAAVAPAGGVTVSLASNASSATVPATVSITAGSRYTTFIVTTSPVATDATATITASVGASSKTATVTVKAPVISQVKIAPSFVSGGVSASGTVYISSNAPTGGITVNLSSDRSFATPPPTVTIAAGTKYKSFTLTTIPAVTDDVANISANIGGASVTANIEVLAPIPTLLKINPSSVNSGGTMPATIVVGSNAPVGGQSIDLSSNMSSVTVPTHVTIPGGTKYATFLVSTSNVATDVTATITASYGNHILHASATALAPTLSSVRLGPTSIFGGFTTAGTVILTGTAPTGGLVVNLASDSADASVPTSVTINAGTRYATFTVNSNTVATTETATITASLGAASTNVVLMLKPTDLAGVRMVYTGVYGGNQLQGKVVLQSYAPSGGTVVSLVSDSAFLTVPATVTVPAGVIQVTFIATSSLVNVSTVATVKAQYGSNIQSTAVSVLPGWPEAGANTLGTGSGIATGPGFSASLQWTFTAGGDLGGLPVVGSDGTVYVGSADHNLYAVNSDGTQKWTFATGASVTGSACLAPDGTVYIGSSDQFLYAVNSNGSLKWFRAVNGTVTGAPTVGSDGTVYVGSGDNNVYALNPTTGSVKWTCNINGNIGSHPVIGADGTVYAGSTDHNLYSINPTNGSVNWTFSTSGSVNAPSIDSSGEIYVSSSDHKVSAINPADASVKWVYGGAAAITGQAIGPDGTIYLGDTSHSLTAISPVDGSYEWSFTGDGAILNAPIISLDGRVYVAEFADSVYGFTSTGTIVYNPTFGYPQNGGLAFGFDGTMYHAGDNGHLYAIR